MNKFFNLKELMRICKFKKLKMNNKTPMKILPDILKEVRLLRLNELVLCFKSN